MYKNTRRAVGEFIERNPKFSALSSLILGYQLHKFLNDPIAYSPSYDANSGSYGKYASAEKEVEPVYLEMAQAELDAIDKETAAFILEKQASVIRAYNNL